PEGFVSRLLGMGDIKALMEKAEIIASEEDLDPEAFMKGKFTLKDVYKQMEAMKKMGPLSKVMDMLPFGFGMQMDENTMEMTQDKMKRFRVIMDSMTDEEMTNPKIVDSSRVKRIAIGSGTSQQEVRELLKYYKTMKNMMKKMKKGKLGKMPFKGFDKLGF
ncbi:MAG: signal recognition particle protein Srp19, partial [Archaeoglobaceae archaeon]